MDKVKQDTEKYGEPNSWPDWLKVRYHIEHGDGFQISDGSGTFNDNPPKYVIFQGSDYLGYTHYSLTEAVIKELLKHEMLDSEKKKLKKVLPSPTPVGHKPKGNKKT